MSAAREVEARSARRRAIARRPTRNGSLHLEQSKEAAA